MPDSLLPPGEPAVPTTADEPVTAPVVEAAIGTAIGTASGAAIHFAAEPEAGEPGVTAAPTEVIADVEASATTAVARSAVAELSPAACAARLAELFPALFKGLPKPLKLRIQADIQQRAPNVFTKKSLSAFLHRHTTTTGYLIALTQTGQRFDLDGVSAGALDEVHVQAAATELARRRGMHEARRAVEQAAHRAAEAESRQARAAEDDARRERALLLRAFETSTLTRANFCALKRIAEPELDTLLATARVEAAQRAQDGWGAPQHDRPGPGPNERHNERQNERNHSGPRGQLQETRRPLGRRPEGQVPRRPAGPPKQAR